MLLFLNNDLVNLVHEMRKSKHQDFISSYDFLFFLGSKVLFSKDIQQNCRSNRIQCIRHVYTSYTMYTSYILYVRHPF